MSVKLLRALVFALVITSAAATPGVRPKVPHDEFRGPGFAGEIKPAECSAQVRRQRLQLELGMASMERDPDLDARFLACLVKLWNSLNRDELQHRAVVQGNANRNDLVATFLSMLQMDPIAFFSVMNKERATVQQWLFDLNDRGAIVVEGSDTCPFEYQRRNLLEIVEGTSVPTDQEALRQRTITRLTQIRCRMFN